MEMWFLNEGTAKITLISVMWLFPFLALLHSSRDEPKWLGREFWAVAFWTLAWLLFSPILFLTKDKELIAAVIKNFFATSLFSILTSLGWKYWRIKKPDSPIHGVIKNSLEKIFLAIIALLAFYVLAALVLLSLAYQEYGFLIIVIGTVIIYMCLDFYDEVVKILKRISNKLGA